MQLERRLLHCPTLERERVVLDVRTAGPPHDGDVFVGMVVVRVRISHAAPAQTQQRVPQAAATI